MHQTIDPMGNKKARRIGAIVGTALLITAFSAETTAINPAPRADSCVLSQNDQAWLDRSVAAWQQTTGDLFERPERMIAVIFSVDCTLVSDERFGTVETAWTGTSHGGDVRTPWGSAIATGPVAYATKHDGQAYFVMAAPSVWQASNVPGWPLGLETLMTAVLLHEATHASQTYFDRFIEIARQQSLPNNFNDDSIQERFGKEPEFVASVVKETDLLFRAAQAQDHVEARRLASEARDMIKARRARWYVGPDAYLADIEDIFWAMEGSGQWTGYRWLTSPTGAGFDPAVALPGFAKRADWWSQTQGLAIMLTLDQLGDESWKRHAFGDSEGGGLAYLEAALGPTD